MMEKMKRVALTPAIAAAIAALSGPYENTASAIANAAAAAKVSADEATGRRGSVFASFKHAITDAQEAGHTPEQMAEGLELACMAKGVPSGTFRGYITTIKNLAADVKAEKLSMAEVEAISVADARKRYKPEPTAQEKAVSEARAKLADVTKDWTAEQVSLLAEYAASLNAEKAEADEAQPEAERKVA